MLATIVRALLLLAQAAPGGAESSAWEQAWDAGRREEALGFLADAARTDPELRLLLVQRLMDVHRHEAALALALELGEAGVPRAGMCLYLLGRHEEALDKLDPRDGLSALMRLDALEMLGREADLPAALQAAAAALGAEQPQVLAARGRLELQAGRAEDAAASFSAALARAPQDPAALFGLGRALLAQGRRDEATAVLEQHRALIPRLDARDAAQRALDLAPAHAGNLALLADAERDLSRWAAAETLYAEAARLATSADRVSIALRHARLLADDLQRLPDAVALLDGRNTEQADPRLLVRAGDLLARAGHVDEARRRYLAALALRPGDAQIGARIAGLEPGDPPDPSR